MSPTLIMRPTGLPLTEPDEVCEACGVRGTVGRAFRTDIEGRPTEMHRFCAACWPEESARYRVHWEEQRSIAINRFMRGEGGPPENGGTGFESATWHSPLELVRATITAQMLGAEFAPSALHELAKSIEESAHTRVGEMPFQLRAFIHKHRLE